MQTNKFIYIVLGLFLGLALSIGISGYANKQKAAPSENDGNYQINPEDIKVFIEALDLINENYVESVPAEELFRNAIKGILTNLDPHSDYYTYDETKKFNENIKGSFGGLGIEITMENGFVKVISPIDDTPAQSAGIQPGDIIIKLDDKPVKGLTLQESVEIMRGTPGTKIILTISRSNTPAPLEVEIIRAEIKLLSVKSSLIDKNIGYLRISSFQENTSKSVRKKLEDIIKVNKLPLKGLIIDLRNNPGGLLSQAIRVSDDFLNKGTIVSIKGRYDEGKQEFNAKDGDITNGATIVVMINEGSASASEILAGALQDNYRAIIVGRTSFGKGSVQTIMDLSNGSSMKLTTARYYTPNGKSIQAKGIMPDIVLDKFNVNIRKESVIEIKEKNLKNQIGSGEEDGKNIKEEYNQTSGDNIFNAENLAREDYELYSAYKVLRSIELAKQLK